MPDVEVDTPVVTALSLWLLPGLSTVEPRLGRQSGISNTFLLNGNLPWRSQQYFLQRRSYESQAFPITADCL
jgi:hypothetical protein